MNSISTSATSRCSSKTSLNDWQGIYARSVLPKLSPADIAWLANVDRAPSARHRCARLLRRLIGGAV